MNGANNMTINNIPITLFDGHPDMANLSIAMNHIKTLQIAVNQLIDAHNEQPSPTNEPKVDLSVVIEALQQCDIVDGHKLIVTFNGSDKAAIYAAAEILKKASK
jgi:hypothetical protein